MDKSAIKTFAVESRRQMIESVKYQASLIGITAEGISEPISKAEGMETYDYGPGTHSIFDEDIEKRKSLVREIENKGFENVVEEVAYTWFNRIIAIRFMEINDYLPTRTRVLSSEIEGKIEPDIITEVYDVDLNFSQNDLDIIFKLKEDNNLNELFQFLFIKQCNKLNEILPGLFDNTEDYKELLLNISFTDGDSIVRHLINDISEEEFSQVEIIGWLYQYYITDLNNLVYDGSFKRKKISKEMLPFATQIFTPDWAVQYMVDNSLGKLWLDEHPNSEIINNLKYYVSNVSSNSEMKNLNIEDIKLIDPCMGSGHILVYIFDLLMKIYKSIGYSNNDAVISILRNNIHGLDIDDRAYQLAYFTIMMKAREYNRRIFDMNVPISLCSIKESNNLNSKLINLIIKNYPNISDDLNYIVSIFLDAKEYGSILNVKLLNFDNIKETILDFDNKVNENLLYFNYKKDFELLKQLIQQAKLLSTQYDVVITNPPYLNSSRFDSKLSSFVKKYYPDVKADLSMVMYEKVIKSLSKKNGYVSFITTNSWLYLTKFEKFRRDVLKSLQFESIVDFGSELFDGKVGHNLIVAWVNKNNKPSEEHDSVAIRLVDYNYSDRELKKSEFFNQRNRFNFNQNDFYCIPGNPIAYWVNDDIINCFKNNKIMDIASVKSGLSTGDNNRFLRYWYEVNFNKIGFYIKSANEIEDSVFKWFPHNKGGDFRKWYGNQEYVVNWENNGFEIKNFEKSVIRNDSFYFKKSLTWSRISSSYFGVRFSPPGFVFDVNGPSLFTLDEYYYYIGALLCSDLSRLFLSILNPTITFQVGNINSIPVILNDEKNGEVTELAKRNITLCKDDWDDYESSWNFTTHPLLKFKESKIQNNFESWEKFKRKQYNLLYENEIRLNKIFSDIYHVNSNINLEPKNISIIEANYERDIKSFISYAVGCMFGRYSLDNEGLQFAGGTFDINNYSKFKPDDDNIIPVLDTEYFDDDIVGRFVEFVKVCFGAETLEDNLDFIAGALKKKGKTSREIIRNYFLTDFFKDHAKMYKKCPIYWQFDSGKQNAFKCLIYMHRYESDIVARVRTDYLHKTQKAIEQNLAHCDNIIANSSNKSEVSKATKDKSKYIKQLDEIRTYDEALGHMANQHVEIDLDDGVKVSYTKFQNIEISKEGEKTKKINLLKNI